MRKKYLIMIFPLWVLFLANISYGWQGRMGGMGDPYGLVQDESDFLIHPAKIAKGEGVKFYGDYRFTYTGVTDWVYKVDGYNFVSLTSFTKNSDISGDEQQHDALLGAVLPLGPGRMGLFFTYNGIRGGYDGDYSDSWGGSNRYKLESDLDNFALRLLYGMPVGDFKLGGEIRFSYRQEENETLRYDDYGEYLNEYRQPISIYMWPYNSSYWEALFKGSLEGKVGPLDLDFTLRGGFLFGGANEWYYTYASNDGAGGRDLDGAVGGWRIGGDVWLRYPLSDGLALPFLVRVDYESKTRDGDGPGFGDSTDDYYDCTHQEKDLAITVGGGVDKEFNKETRIAGGIYYNYLQKKEDIFLSTLNPIGWFNRGYNYPDSAEHQVLLRFVGEHNLSPAVALRGGLSFFYGWLNAKGNETEENYDGYIAHTKDSSHGYHWGGGLSVGGTIKFNSFTLEPFANGGYQQFHLKGDGEYVNNTVGLNELYDEKLTRNEWFVGGGLSILFGQ